MGLFKSQEEKERIKKIQEEEKRNRYLASGLAIGEYDDDKIEEYIYDEIKTMFDNAPDAALGIGLTLTGKQEFAETINAIKIVTKQNWIIIKQNELMIRELKKLNGSDDDEAPIGTRFKK